MPTFAIRDAETLERRSSPDRPAVVFKHVSLAFDGKAILRDISFTLLPGHTKIILGASGSGKSTILKLILGLLKPDGGEIWIHGSRVDRMPEAEMMKVRNHLGMVFQEGALFDSLTVGENVGYKLYEETDMPLDDVRRRVQQVLGFVRLSEHIEILQRVPHHLLATQLEVVLFDCLREVRKRESPNRVEHRIGRVGARNGKSDVVTPQLLWGARNRVAIF